MTETPYTNSIFETPMWLDAVAGGKWGEVTVEENGETVARLPYVLEGKKIVMPPLTQTLGPWIKPEYREAQSGNTQLSKQKELIGELLSKLPKHKSFEMYFDSSNDYILPYRWLGYEYAPSFSYRLSELSDIDGIYANFNKTAKKNIKAALNKTQIYTETNIETLLSMLDKTFEAQGRKNPMPKDMIKSIVDTCEAGGNGKYIEARDSEGNVHSCAYFVYDERVCYYLFGASDQKFRASGSQSLVIWEGIKFASEHSRAFDFEGSNVEGIENFFRQFGGDRVINYRVTKQTLAGQLAEVIKPRVKRMLGYKI